MSHKTKEQLKSEENSKVINEAKYQLNTYGYVSFYKIGMPESLFMALKNYAEENQIGFFTPATNMVCLVAYMANKIIL